MYWFWQVFPISVLLWEWKINGDPMIPLVCVTKGAMQFDNHDWKLVNWCPFLQKLLTQRTRIALHVVASLSFQMDRSWAHSILFQFVRPQLVLHNREAVFHNSTTKHITPSINICTNTHSSRQNTLQKRMQGNAKRTRHVYADKFHPSVKDLWSLSSSDLMA